MLADYWVLQELFQVPKLLLDPSLDFFLKKVEDPPNPSLGNIFQN